MFDAVLQLHIKSSLLLTLPSAKCTYLAPQNSTSRPVVWFLMLSDGLACDVSHQADKQAICCRSSAP